MAKLLGRQRSTGLGKESSYGVDVAATQWIPIMENTINDRKATITDNSGVGTRDDIISTGTDYRYSDGNINGVIYDRSFGLIALAAFGSVSTANHATATGVKVHTINLANSLPSFTIATKDANEDVRYAGALLNQLEISGAVGSYATFSSSWMGRKSEAVANTPAFVRQNNFLPSQIKLYLAEDVAGLDAADAECFTDFTFTLNNNISTNGCLGTVDPDFDPGTRNLALTLTKTYVNDAFKDLVMGATQYAFRIEMVNEDVTIGTAVDPEDNTHPSIKIDFEPGEFSEWSREGGLDDLMTEAINYQPIRSFSTAKALTMTITNTEASY